MATLDTQLSITGTTEVHEVIPAQDPYVMSWLLESEPQVNVDRVQANSRTQSSLRQSFGFHSPTQSELRGGTQSIKNATEANTQILRSPDAQKNAVSSWVKYGGARQSRDEWQQLEEVKVRLTDVPPNATPKDLYRMFWRDGHMSKIEITRSGNGRAAYLTFCPPPQKPFWNQRKRNIPGSLVSLGMSLVRTDRRLTQPSPVNPNYEYPEKTILVAKSLEVGVMVDETSMMVMETVRPTQKSKVTLKLDLYMKFVEISFALFIAYTGAEAKINNTAREIDYRLRIPLSQLKQIYQGSKGPGQRALRISLGAPPKYFRRNPNVMDSFAEGDLTKWNDWQCWIRQTYIEHDEERGDILRSPTTLHRNSSIIDIGRWTTYRLVFEESANNPLNYETILRALDDFNVKILPSPAGAIRGKKEAAFWHLLEEVERASELVATPLTHLGADLVPLDFSVRYQLEACISRGKLCDYNIDRDFLVKLSGMPKVKARALLEKVMEDPPYFNPMDIFGLRVASKPVRTLAPHYVFMHNATITPTTMIIGTPTQEISNRVVRQYAEYSERFLRVKFTDETTEGRLHGTDDSKLSEILTRIKLTMKNGIDIAGRHYEFLAFGNSQFRENGAYFFSRPNDSVYAGKMREFLGDFGEIKIVAKYCARIGQCFSTTRAMNCGTIEVSTVEDIQRNGFIFSDGVGKISKFLLMQVATDWGIPHDCENDPPSLIQFRLGGCKGVLALAHGLKLKEIVIRRSQYKFPANHAGLEIVRVSLPMTAQLNRQIIMVLSNLGVSDQIFVEKMRQQLKEMDEAMKNRDEALTQLQRYIDENQMTITLASIILDGFMDHKDPFILSVLHLWRAWRLKKLKEKANIQIEESALVFGCIDETGELEGHYEALQSRPGLTRKEKLDHLPEVFLQISNKNVCKVIESICVLARNPSLHPGDVRVVKAVDVPSLRHLKNVVVLPQNGDRDVANMCSGGDLDGDDYMIIWDEELIPQEVNHPPMDYSAPNPPEKDNVTVDDLSTFFVNYIKNDQLGTIANAHLAQADRLENGVKSDVCLKLAELHSCAVDYPKSGIPAKISKDLRPQSKPHFMRPRSGKMNIYHSKKILGQLFDQVEPEDFHPVYDAPFDDRVLKAYVLSEQILKEAAEVKIGYDEAIRRLMAQYDIGTEFEVWSTFVLAHNASSDYEFRGEIGKSMKALRDFYSKLCIVKSGGKDEKDMDKLGPFIAAMYTVTAKEVEVAIMKRKAKAEDDPTDLSKQKTSEKHMPLMSFPWIFLKEMGQIANSKDGTTRASATAQQGFQRRNPRHHKSNTVLASVDDDLTTAQGITHRGDVLELFEDAERQDAERQDAERAGHSVTIDQFTQENASFLAVIDSGMPNPKPDTISEKPYVTPERDYWAPRDEVEAAWKVRSNEELQETFYPGMIDLGEEKLTDNDLETTALPIAGNVLHPGKSNSPDDLAQLLDVFSIGLDKVPSTARTDTPEEDLKDLGGEAIVVSEYDCGNSDKSGIERLAEAEAEEVVIALDEKPSVLTWLEKHPALDFNSDDEEL